MPESEVGSSRGSSEGSLLARAEKTARELLAEADAEEEVEVGQSEGKREEVDEQMSGDSQVLGPAPKRIVCVSRIGRLACGLSKALSKSTKTDP